MSVLFRLDGTCRQRNSIPERNERHRPEYKGERAIGGRVVASRILVHSASARHAYVYYVYGNERGNAVYGKAVLNFFFGDITRPTEVMNLNYWIFTKSTQENAALEYGYNSALSLLLTLITIPVTFGVKAIMEKADPMND